MARLSVIERGCRFAVGLSFDFELLARFDLLFLDVIDVIKRAPASPLDFAGASCTLRLAPVAVANGANGIVRWQD